jgi:hypothetical protein
MMMVVVIVVVAIAAACQDPLEVLKSHFIGTFRALAVSRNALKKGPHL